MILQEDVSIHDAKNLVLVLYFELYTLYVRLQVPLWYLFEGLLDRGYFEERTNYAPACEDTVPQVQAHGR